MLLAALACGPAGQEEDRSAAAPGGAATSGSGDRTGGAARADGAGRAYRCDGYRFEVLTAGDSAWLFLPDRTVVLGRSAGGSGVRWEAGEDEATSFRAEGERARLATPGRTRTGCRLVASRSAWAEALLRGAEFRALGQEPGWELEVFAGDSIVFRHHYGERRTVARDPSSSRDGPASRRIYRARTHDGELTVEIEREPCRDAMSGFGFPATVVVTLAGNRYRGCGRPLRPEGS